MKSVFLRYLSGAILLAVSFAAFAVEGPDGAPGSHGGLQISLSTGGYRFVVEDGSDETVRAHGKRVVSGFERRTAFPASVLLANRSNTDLKFAFPNEAAAERHFRFRLFDQQGKELWVSDEAPPTVQTEATLERRSTWRRTVLVPLKINGAALAPGKYTLEALLDADQQLGATAIFEIVAPRNPDPDTQTGIKGRVVQAVTLNAGENIPGLTEVPLKGVPVAITEILDPNIPHVRSPFFWQGLTDDDGQFERNTPPGRFRVTATLPLAPLPITRDGSLQVPARILTQSVEVTVEPGIFRETVLRFPAKPPVPPSDTGIRGLVFIGPINPAQPAGEANEAPLAGAQVRVEEIRLPNARYSRPAFSWSGVTNIEGRFQVRTPAGKFRVTARQALIVFEPRRSMYQRVSNVFTPGNQASRDVVVEEGKFSAITLRIDSGVR